MFLLFHAGPPLLVLLKGGWALAHLFASQATVVKWLSSFLINHSGPMFGYPMLNKVGLGVCAIVAVLTGVRPLFLVLPIHMFFKGSLGTEPVAACARGPVAYYRITYPMDFLKVPC